MKFDPNIPIYLQIMDDFKKGIISGLYPPASKVDSVRELAVTYGVNPNTVQRALAELERTGMVRSERTSGRFITDDETLIKTLRQEVALAQVKHFLHECDAMGLGQQEIKDILATQWD